MLRPKTPPMKAKIQALNAMESIANPSISNTNNALNDNNIMNNGTQNSLININTNNNNLTYIDSFINENQSASLRLALVSRARFASKSII